MVIFLDENTKFNTFHGHSENLNLIYKNKASLSSHLQSILSIHIHSQKF